MFVTYYKTEHNRYTKWCFPR